MELRFGEYSFGEPKYDERECRERDATYAAPLRVERRADVKETGEVKEQELFMGDFPLMTDHRHFHHQRRRARRRQPARALPRRLLHQGGGPDHRPRPRLRQGHPEPRRLARVRDLQPRLLSVKVDRKRKIPVTTLLRAIERRGQAHEMLGNARSRRRRHQPGPPLHPRRSTGHRRHTQDKALPRSSTSAAPRRPADARERPHPGELASSSTPPLRPGQGRPLQAEQGRPVAAS